MKKKLTKYVSNIFKSVTQVFKAIFLGHEFPRPFGLVMWHTKHAEITQLQFMTAYGQACEQMLDRGFTIANYELREFSCGVYAMQLGSLIAQNLARENEFNLAAPIRLVDYSRDKDGKGHVRIEATYDGKVRYFEPYAEIKYRGEKPMSDSELKYAGIIQI